MLSRQTLKELKVLNIKEFNISELQELGKIKLNTDLPVQVRLELFLCQIGNPYYFTVNGTPVQISFADNQKSLDETLSNYFTDIKNLDN